MWGTKCKTKINQSRSTRNWLWKFVTGREGEEKWCGGGGLLVTRGIGPEQVVHECSEAQVLAAQTFGFGSSDQTTRRFLPLVLAVCRKYGNVIPCNRGSWLAECRKGTKGTFFSARCTLSRKSRGLTSGRGTKKKKQLRAERLSPWKSSDSLP